jgi:hypothetical protein
LGFRWPIEQWIAERPASQQQYLLPYLIRRAKEHQRTRANRPGARALAEGSEAAAAEVRERRARYVPPAYRYVGNARFPPSGTPTVLHVPTRGGRPAVPKALVMHRSSQATPRLFRISRLAGMCTPSPLAGRRPPPTHAGQGFRPSLTLLKDLRPHRLHTSVPHASKCSHHAVMCSHHASI